LPSILFDTTCLLQQIISATERTTPVI